MDIFSGLGRLNKMAYEQEQYAMQGNATSAPLARPRTIAETIDDQIAMHERKLADLKAAKELLSNSEILKALEALQKLSW